ncbi:MAG: helix-turn-helix transcriptional regulator [Armatimonadota bacterium]
MLANSGCVELRAVASATTKPNMALMVSKATKARLAAGLTLEEAAKRARVCVAYLRSVEREGASFVLATRLSRIYNCGMDEFL